MKFGLFIPVIAMLWTPSASEADPVNIFSGSGFVVPETITPIPAGFGTVGGNYFVPDFDTGDPTSLGKLWVLPAAGGAPVAFANLAGGQISGVFIPAGYGSLSGQFLVSGNNEVQAVDSSGAVTTLNPATFAEGATVAPAGFGSVGGKVLLGNVESDGVVDILVFNTDGTTSVFATIGTESSTTGSPSPFGMGFAPAGFGTIGGDLLVSDGASGNLYAIDSSGNVSLFATLPVPVLSSGLIAGLRQFAFAPSGFASFGGDLFVSVSGSQTGGGTSGSVDVVDNTGNVIAALLEGTVGMPFDPRGLFFTGDNQVLIADTDPGILAAAPGAFTPTPEPTSIVLLALATLPALGALRARPRA